MPDPSNAGQQQSSAAKPGYGASIELLARIQEGDTSAFGDLYRRYHDELLFAVRTHLGPGLRSALESEDVLQSVVVDAFKALPKFEHRGPGSLQHFMHTMIVNKIRSRATYFAADKRAGTEPLGEFDPVAPSGGTEPSYHDAERFERLEQAMENLPEDMRRVVILRKVDGLPSQEAAEVMGRSDAAVRKLYSRALARLALLMAEEPT